MTLPYEFAYLFWALFFGLFWSLFYYLKPSVRREMLILSAVMGVLGPVAAFFATHDYYQPVTLFGTRVGVEDFLVGFFYGGVAAAIYEILFFKKPNRSSKPGKPELALTVIGLGIALLYLGVFVFDFSSVYVVSLILIAVGLSMSLYRSHLLKHGVLSGVLFTVLTFIFFQIFLYLFPGIVDLWWHGGTAAISTVSGIPVAELLFAFSWGFALGPASELVAKLRFSFEKIKR